MIIITSFKLVLNTSAGFFYVFSDELAEDSCCPLCGDILIYRDSRLRGVKDLVGFKIFYLLRRLRCCLCRKLHTEIPDIIQPFKHYDSATIQCVIDESEDAGLCGADNATIRRWKTSFTEAEPDLAQRLASVYAQETDEKVPLASPAMTFAAIRATIERWLSFVMHLLINNGHKLFTRFAFCPSPPNAKISQIGQKNRTGGRQNDKTIENTG